MTGRRGRDELIIRLRRRLHIAAPINGSPGPRLMLPASLMPGYSYRVSILCFNIGPVF